MKNFEKWKYMLHVQNEKYDVDKNMIVRDLPPD